MSTDVMKTAATINDFPSTEEITQSELRKLAVECMTLCGVETVDYLVEHTPKGDTMSLFVSMAQCVEEKQQKVIDANIVTALDTQLGFYLNALRNLEAIQEGFDLPTLGELELTNENMKSLTTAMNVVKRVGSELRKMRDKHLALATN